MSDRLPENKGKEPTVWRESDVASTLRRRQEAGDVGQMQLQLASYEDSYGITSAVLHRRVVSGVLGQVPAVVAQRWDELYMAYKDRIRWRR